MKKLILLCLLVVCTPLAHAQEAKNPETQKPETQKLEPISDNSFLIEEAYNQEPGIVQHINTFMRLANGEWAYSFTQEWPVSSIKHQLSLTAIGMQLGEGSERHRGAGDLALNYRYQLKGGDSDKLSISPRVSVILPVGSVQRGFGTGGYGLQTNLPVSVPVGKRFVTHWNAGATYTLQAKNADHQKANTIGFNLGQSTIYVLSKRVNLIMENVWNSNQSVIGPGSKRTNYSMYLNPGVRWAHNFKSGLQIVPGVAVPMGVGPSRGTHGLFFYLSFEHPFKKVVSQ